MIHARPDYNRIQDPEGKIGEDEPVILFRAQDKLFTLVLEWYLFSIEHNHPDAQQAGLITEQIRQHLERAHRWQATHDVKYPDVPAAGV